MKFDNILFEVILDQYRPPIQFIYDILFADSKPNYIRVILSFW